MTMKGCLPLSLALSNVVLLTVRYAKRRLTRIV